MTIGLHLPPPETIELQQQRSKTVMKGSGGHGGSRLSRWVLVGHHATKWLPDQLTLSWGVGLKVVKGVSSRRVGCLPVFCSHGITCPLELLVLSEP